LKAIASCVLAEVLLCWQLAAVFFLSHQISTSHQPGSSTFLSRQISTSHSQQNRADSHVPGRMELLALSISMSYGTFAMLCRNRDAQFQTVTGQ